MGEYVENLGRQQQLRKEHARLVTRCVTLREQLRRALPIEEDIECLDTENVLQTAVDLHETSIELAGISKKIAVLSKALGS